MSNDVMPSNRYQPGPFGRVAAETSRSAHLVGNLLRFTKHGEWKAGQEKEIVPEGTRMLAYMPSLKDGWVKWQDNQPAQHLVQPVLNEAWTPPPRNALGDTDKAKWPLLGGQPNDPWQRTFYLVMCDQEGQLYTFTTSSKTGRSAIGELCAAYENYQRMKPNEIPIVELQGRPYENEFGEQFAPKFKVTGWTLVPDIFAEVAAAINSELASATTPGQEFLASPQPMVESEQEPEPEPEPEPVRGKAKAAVKATVKAAPPQKPKRNGGKSLNF